jgi:hypothetical protein
VFGGDAAGLCGQFSPITTSMAPWTDSALDLAVVCAI